MSQPLFKFSSENEDVCWGICMGSSVSGMGNCEATQGVTKRVPEKIGL